MPIPDADRAIAAREMIRDYLLNPDHSDGGSKAKWFRSLGYDRDDWELLAADLVAIARHCASYEAETTPYGVKYRVRGRVGSPGRRPGVVLTVWIVEDENPPRLVTAYPDDTK